LNAKPNDEWQDLEVPIDVYGFNVSNEYGLHNFSMILADGDSNMRMFLKTSETLTEPYFTLLAQRSGGLGPSGVVIELVYHDGNIETWEWDVAAMKDDEDNFNVDFLSNNGTIRYRTGQPSWTWDNENICNETYDNSNNSEFTCGAQKLVQHYMSLVGPTFTFYPGEHPHFTGFDPDNSSYIFYYNVLPPRITFMHIVEHKMEVKVG